MKLYIKYLTIGLMATTMLASCADILDKKPLTEISDNDLWSDPALLKAFVNSRYNQVGVNGAESMQSSIVDETELTWLRGCETHNFARLSPTDLGRMNGAWWGWDNRSWSTKWTNISNCNIFFERVDNVGFTDEAEKRSWWDRYVSSVPLSIGILLPDGVPCLSLPRAFLSTIVKKS